MRLYLFSDLDDSLFQSHRKILANSSSDNLKDYTVIDWLEKDKPICFISQRQKTLLSLFQNAHVIPVTARNLTAFKRIELPFKNEVVLNYGASIYLPNGEEDLIWKEKIFAKLAKYQPLLIDLLENILNFIQKEKLTVRARLIGVEQGNFYLVAKNYEHDKDFLPLVHQFGKSILSNEYEWVIHRNGNNLAFIPTCLNKVDAVKYVIDTRIANQGDDYLTLGLGDSLVDLDFMNKCHYALIPNNSQIQKVKMLEHNFSGSYEPQDVQILLKPVEMDFVDVNEKEKSIQSGKLHYSEMLSHEQLPSDKYMQLFKVAMQNNADQLAKDVLELAKIIIDNKNKRNIDYITLVSLARAGTPIGVLLKRTLELLGQRVFHYSISIIRDREIDYTALRYILEHDLKLPQSFFFIDGWTGKGVIGRELKRFVQNFYRSDGILLPDELYVIADLCGEADYFATTDDYLLPSSILNAIVSGLISRSVLNSKFVGPQDFHACAYYSQWQNEDLSKWFIEEIFNKVIDYYSALKGEEFSQKISTQNEDLFKKRAEFITLCQNKYNVSDINHIKPGIGEATRVLLRRVPRLIFIREHNHPDTAHLEELAKEKSVQVIEESSLPYAALAIIRTMQS